MRHHGDDVGAEAGFGQVLPDEVQKGLVVVLVGDGDAGDDGQCPEDVGRQSGVFCQFLFHGAVACLRAWAVFARGVSGFAGGRGMRVRRICRGIV